MWWNGSVVAVQTAGSAVRILLELSFFSFFFPQKFSSIAGTLVLERIGTGTGRLATALI